jgi:hypothetical protein
MIRRCIVMSSNDNGVTTRPTTPPPPNGNARTVAQRIVRRVRAENRRRLGTVIVQSDIWPTLCTELRRPVFVQDAPTAHPLTLTGQLYTARNASFGGARAVYDPHLRTMTAIDRFQIRETVHVDRDHVIHVTRNPDTGAFRHVHAPAVQRPVLKMLRKRKRSEDTGRDDDGLLRRTLAAMDATGTDVLTRGVLQRMLNEDEPVE